MTKIINQLEEKINKSAFNLFAQKGYSRVTMQMVAQEVSISVGTLYNYYGNKEDLFLKVFKEAFNQIYNNLESIIRQNKNSYNFFSVLYDEIVRLQGFSRELMREKINHEVIQELREHLLMLVRSLVYQAGEKGDLTISEKDQYRMMRLLFLAMHDFAREFPDDREGNIDFICRLTDKIK